MRWDRCDAIGCKSQPIKYVSIHMVSSAFPEKKYIAYVRVCKTHYEKEIKAPTFIEVIKTRHNIPNDIMEKP